MKHRIAAGVIVENDNKILLVRHMKPDAYDFWVAPGGGAEGTEDLLSAAKREVFEESGLRIEPLQLAYIEEFSNPHTRECKVWFTGLLIGGTINVNAIEATRESILYWVATTHHRRQREFAALRASGRFTHLTWYEFRQPADAKEWLFKQRQASALI